MIHSSSSWQLLTIMVSLETEFKIRLHHTKTLSWSCVHPPPFFPPPLRHPDGWWWWCWSNYLGAFGCFLCFDTTFAKKIVTFLRKKTFVWENTYKRENTKTLAVKEISKLILNVHVKEEKRPTKVHVYSGSWTVHQLLNLIKSKDKNDKTIHQCPFHK